VSLGSYSDRARLLVDVLMSMTEWDVDRFWDPAT